MEQDKLINLADGEILYNDLRDRIENDTIKDVKVNGTSVSRKGVASVPLASANSFGVVKIGDSLSLDNTNKINVNVSSSIEIKNGFTNEYFITPGNQHESVFYGLAKIAGDNVLSTSGTVLGTYTESAKSKISDMLNAPEIINSLSPTLVAKSGVRYVFGTLRTLTLTVPASGCVDILFKSGTTPTSLNISSAKSGVSAIKWSNGWDEVCEANTTYEINILDGEFGVVAAWT